MNISKFTIAWKWLFGGMGSVTDYLLDELNKALSAMVPGNKAKAQAALNIAQCVLATLFTLQWLCPVKWQTAYGRTVAAAGEVVASLKDLVLTAEELAGIRATFGAAVVEWKSPDDETCEDNPGCNGDCGVTCRDCMAD